MDLLPSKDNESILGLKFLMWKKFLNIFPDAAPMLGNIRFVEKLDGALTRAEEKTSKVHYKKYLEVHYDIKRFMTAPGRYEDDLKIFFNKIFFFQEKVVLPRLPSFFATLNKDKFPDKAEWRTFKTEFGFQGNSFSSKVFAKLSNPNKIDQAKRVLEDEDNIMLFPPEIRVVFQDILALIDKRLGEMNMMSIDINQYKAFESYGSRYAGHSNHRVTEDADLMALDDRISNLEQKVEMMGRRMEEDFMKLRRRFHEHKHYSARRHDEHERAQIKAALRYLEKKLLH